METYLKKKIVNGIFEETIGKLAPNTSDLKKAIFNRQLFDFDKTKVFELTSDLIKKELNKVGIDKTVQNLKKKAIDNIEGEVKDQLKGLFKVDEKDFNIENLAEKVKSLGKDVLGVPLDNNEQRKENDDMDPNNKNDDSDDMKVDDRGNGQMDIGE